MLADSAATPDMSNGLEEVEAWLATCSDDPKRLKRALAVCTMPPGKEKRFEVQKLSGSTEWNVTQKTQGVKRTAEQLHSALAEKVVCKKGSPEGVVRWWNVPYWKGVFLKV